MYVKQMTYTSITQTAHYMNRWYIHVSLKLLITWTGDIHVSLKLLITWTGDIYKYHSNCSLHEQV